MKTRPLAVTTVVPVFGPRVVPPITTELPVKMTGRLFTVTVGDDGLPYV